MKIVIEVQNLSKQYRIYRQDQCGYNTLVETLTKKAKQCFKALCNPITKNSQSPSDPYETFWALQDINLTIQEGDRVGIVGRNGAGKSTLLKILSRITEPTTGSIKVRGRISSLLEVGTGFHPELTGRENIYLNGAILGMSRQEMRKRFDEIVAFAEVEKFLDTPVKRFSSGMYTRLGFAIAAHLDSDLLIVDEVLAVGDTQFQEKCLKKLDALSSYGRTILFVSHDVGSILTLCNKGIFLEKGRIKAIGPIDQCISSYMQTYRTHSFSWQGDEGDENVRFHQATLLTKEPKEFFYQGEKVRFQVKYQVLKPVEDLVLGIGIWNQRNQLLGRSHTWDDIDTFDVITKPGLKTASFELDASLFHEGEYLIKLDCFIHNKKRIIGDEVSLKFPVYKQKKNTRFTHASEQTGVFLGNQWNIAD